MKKETIWTRKIRDFCYTSSHTNGTFACLQKSLLALEQQLKKGSKKPKH